MRTTLRSAAHQFFALVILALPLAAAAQTMHPEQVGLSSQRLERIDALVERYIDSGDISGAVTLVARNGRIAHLKAQGAMDLESKRPMRTDAMFRIASMSKPVAGVAIMMLIEEGKIRLNDPVSRFLPGFENLEVAVIKGPAAPQGFGFGGPPPDYYTVPAERAITIRDLLTHTSGLMSGRVGSAVANPYFESRHEVGLAWVERLGQVPLEFQPGSRWSYSAVGGFDLLSRIVEIASGKNFNEFVQQRIFGPLGVEDATFWPTPEQRARLVTSYRRGDDGLFAVDNPDSMSGAKYFSGAGGLRPTPSSA